MPVDSTNAAWVKARLRLILSAITAALTIMAARWRICYELESIPRDRMEMS
jgi:hypothetical protein